MKTLYDKLKGFRNKYTHLYVFLLGLLTSVVCMSVLLVFFYLLINYFTISLFILLIVCFTILIGTDIAKELDNQYG